MLIIYACSHSILTIHHYLISMKLSIQNYQAQPQDVKRACLRLYQWAMQKQLRSVKLVIADDQYYNKTYEQRMEILNAPSIYFLCKTIVFQNTAYEPKFNDPFYPQYIAVVIQYVAKIHTEKLTKEVRKFQQKNSTTKISKQFFHFRLADQKISDQITGYQHNGVVPILMKNSLPLFISHHIPQLNPRCFWLGGGHPWAKIRISFQEFSNSYNDQLVVANITY